MRLLGVDYGTKRVGLSISDADRKIASPLSIHHRRGERQDARRFQELAKEERIGGIVVGLPVRTTGSEGSKAAEARAFGVWLQKETGLPVVFWDERFTTADAEQLLQEAGLTSKRRKARIDMVAAQIMLQSYLDAGCPERADIQPLEGE
jgi:putative Holliday junction resolvase